jgi:trehalose-phosphatase
MALNYLFENWKKLQKKIAHKYLVIFLDYDGTLVPIAKRPGMAVLSWKTRSLLKTLSEDHRFKIAVISGRALKDIKHKLRLSRIIYSGNHGLEIEGPQLKFSTSVPGEYRATLGHIKNELAKKVSSIKGAFIEDKGLSLSLHFRLVDEDKRALVKTIFHEVTMTYRIKGIIKTKSGKMVLEVRPIVNWDKGKVVLWLLSRQRFAMPGKEVFPIYIGDDLTDEDAFKALRNKGLTIFVGEPKESYARYYLKKPEEVVDFLRKISKI